MFFSQARAAGYMFAFARLSKATFTSGPGQKGGALYESMQTRVGRATLKAPVWYVQACLFLQDGVSAKRQPEAAS